MNQKTESESDWRSEIAADLVHFASEELDRAGEAHASLASANTELLAALQSGSSELPLEMLNQLGALTQDEDMARQIREASQTLLKIACSILGGDEESLDENASVDSRDAVIKIALSGVMPSDYRARLRSALLLDAQDHETFTVVNARQEKSGDVELF